MESVESTYGPLARHEKAYLFFPTQKEQKTEFTKKGTRLFYFGQIEHDEYEKKKLAQFHEYVAKNKSVYDKELFDDQRILLYLQGNSYKPKETLTAMNNHLAFRKEYLPMEFTKVEKLIKNGYFYPCGRDKCFRPILVFDVKLVEFKNIESGVEAGIFVHEEIIKNMILPGQVENWIVIYDLGNLGLTQIPMNSLKGVIAKISSNYGGKLFKMFVVNAPPSVYITWKIISAFLDPVTVEKIKLSKTGTEKSLFDFADPSQIQQKYGGKQPNRKEYWPFKIPEAVYDEKRLITLEEYEAKLKKGELKRNIIHPKFSEKKE